MSGADYERESRERWSRVAAGWERREAEQWAATEAVSRDLVDRLELKPGETVLELAAGVGQTSLLAAEAVVPGGCVISTDFAPAMVDAARRLAERIGVDAVEHRVMDAQAIDLPDASVDAVLCRWGLMLFGDAARALAEVRRVLRHGRALRLRGLGAATDNPWASVVGRVFVTRGLMEPPVADAPGMFSLADADRLEALLRDAGFAVGGGRGRAGAVPLAELRRVLGGHDATSAAASPTRSRRCPRTSATPSATEVEQGAEAFRTADGYEFPGLCHNAVAS